eukprot:SAG31_NODE_2770_length_5116_cov_3.834164_1_plen_88_part_10
MRELNLVRRLYARACVPSLPTAARATRCRDTMMAVAALRLCAMLCCPLLLLAAAAAQSLPPAAPPDQQCPTAAHVVRGAKKLCGGAPV